MLGTEPPTGQGVCRTTYRSPAYRQWVRHDTYLTPKRALGTGTSCYVPYSQTDTGYRYVMLRTVLPNWQWVHVTSWYVPYSQTGSRYRYVMLRTVLPKRAVGTGRHSMYRTPKRTVGTSYYVIIIIIRHSFYIALFSALEQTHCAHWHVILNEWLCPFIARIVNIYGSGVLVELRGCCMAGAT